MLHLAHLFGEIAILGIGVFGWFDDELGAANFDPSTGDAGKSCYDALSRRNNLCLRAGLSSCQTNTAWANQVAYYYETLDGQLNQLTHTLNTTTVGFNYARNAAYQIKTLSATDTTYLPAPAAGVSTSYVPNGLNEYGSIGNQTSTYDLNGNLLTWYPPSGEQTYSYDSENRLVSAAVAGSTTPTAFYDYDALGRRVSKTFNGVVTTYLLDGDEEIAEYSGTTLLRRYITGPGVDDRIAHVEISTATKTYYHTNHQGSVMAMTDNAGNVTESMSYDEYGNGTPTTGEQFGYTGRRFDPETGLYYYRARYYAPLLGRFLQTDPVGYKDDIDLYTYVGNDPLDKTDPSGNEGMGCWNDGTGCGAQKPPEESRARADRPNQTWREKIFGRAQKTGTDGHATRSAREAVDAAKSPNTERVSLNQSMQTTTGDKGVSNVRPDVTVVSKPDENGTKEVNVREVPSKSQTPANVQNYYQKALESLRGAFRPGSVEITPITTTPAAPVGEVKVEIPIGEIVP